MQEFFPTDKGPKFRVDERKEDVHLLNSKEGTEMLTLRKDAPSISYFIHRWVSVFLKHWLSKIAGNNAQQKLPTT